MRRALGLTIGLMVLSSFTLTGIAHPRAALAAEGDPELTATLDGKPIPLEDVGKYFCDDFSYPEIQCSRSRLVPDARATLVGLLAAVDYVTIWDQTAYGGAFMNVSQNYSALSLIGWNDRISSFKARNSQNGAFYVDWFYGGSFWAFCCNSQFSSLGSYNNTFSSITRS